MAEINIQRKKKAASPWLLILLALLLVGLGIWYLVSRDPGPEQSPPPTAPAPESTVTPGAPTHDSAAASAAVPTGDPSVGALASETETEVAEDDAEAAAEPADFYALVADDPASGNYARRGLTLLSGVLVGMADRPDLRDQAIAEKRNDLTSATSRLSSGGSLRPGLVAAAELMQEMQRRGYSSVERETNALVERANQLSGRTATPAEQRATQEFFQQAANVLRVLEKPAQT
ncbi:hypothetical protein D3Y59_15290 [Hymenobacter oligotrophus]|uniref:Uncharacterized protein n=1 Tax=Hymenobacter oligotrophus TaxID=2319843 RepID=A0A3B7R2P7_9BACT|nr:hypothetical protein [Hymenobacter oligotrophus]AYA38285.1 hypothetical protein D3Y59_15290 [Hymenobacter oligotrophus]